MKAVGYVPEALAARRAADVRLGRKSATYSSRLDKYRPEIVALLRNGSRKNFIAARYGVTEPTLYNWLSKNSSTLLHGLRG